MMIVLSWIVTTILQSLTLAKFSFSIPACLKIKNSINTKDIILSTKSTTYLKTKFHYQSVSNNLKFTYILSAIYIYGYIHFIADSKDGVFYKRLSSVLIKNTTLYYWIYKKVESRKKWIKVSKIIRAKLPGRKNIILWKHTLNYRLPLTL